MAEQVLSSLQKRLNLKTGKAFTLGTLILIFASGAIFYFYVSQNYTYLVERNFRLLATWSKELRETYENNLESIKFRLNEIQTEKGDLVTSRSVGTPSTVKGPILQDFEDISTQRLYFEDRASKEKIGTRSIALSPIQEKLGKLPYVRIDQVSKDARGQPASSPLPLGLNLQTDTQSTPEDTGKEKESDASLSASFDLDQLIKSVVTEPVFNDVLLVDPTGLIVYQRNPSSFRFFHLRNLLHNQRVDNGWWADVLKKSGLDADKPFDDKNLNEAIQSIVPAHVQVTLGGTDYEIFMQAVVFPTFNDVKPGSISNPTPWILCGLLPTSTFRDQYLAVPFTVLLFFMFLIVSALLVLPSLSLVLMSPREQLSRFSVATLLVTNILGAGVGTFFVWDLAFYQRTTSHLNERLQAVAESTHEAFQIQLDRLLWQLNTFDQKIEELQDLERLSQSTDSKTWLARVALPDPCVNTVEPTSQHCFPDYSLAFWVDSNGMLRETWSPGKKPYVQGVHDLRHREYVSTIQNERLPLYRRQINNQWIEFHLQPLISLENSERSFVVSMPHGASRHQADPHQQWIAAIQTEELGVLKSAVVPPGSGLAILDNQTGQVLFHSDAHRMLRENFLEETDDNAELAALIHARAEGRFEGKYWGTGHHFYVKPIEDLPWTLVVFRSKEMFRTINFEILMFSSCLFTLYIFALLGWLKVLSIGYRSDHQGQAVRWLWPRQSACQAYNRLSLRLVGFTILGLFCIVWVDWQGGTAHAYAIGAVLIPILGLWLTVRTLWQSAGKGWIPTEPSQSERLAAFDSPKLLNAYARLGIASFVLLGVLPATLFFKLAHDEEMRLFVQQQMWGLAQSLEQHSHELWRQVGTGETRQTFQYLARNRPCLIPGCQVDGQTPNEMENRPCVRSLTSGAASDLQYILQGVYVDLSFPVCLTMGSARNVSGLPEGAVWLHTLHQLVRKSSLQNPMNQESWGFIHPKNQTSTTQWARNRERTYQAITLRLPQFPQALAPQKPYRMLELQSAAPLFPWNLSPVLFATILIGGIMFLISYGFLRYVIMRVFPLPSFGPQSPDAMSTTPIVPNGSLQNILILGPPGSGKSALTRQLHQEHEWARFDLHTINTQEGWAEASLAQFGKTPGAVVIDHFEYRMGNSAHDQEKHMFIEGLISRDIKVCLISACNPYEWATLPATEDSAPSLGGSQGPWTDLFCTFGLVYFNPQNTEALIREWLKPQQRDESINNSKHAQVMKRVLQQETDATVHLRKVRNWICLSKEWAWWSLEDMKDQIGLVALPYYRSLWELCSMYEKLALYHVASDGYLHTHNPELKTLCYKGLLRVNPDIQFLNESFRSFVLARATDIRVAEWEAGATPNTWARLKYPLLLVFGIIVVFLFATQQEFKNSFITLVSLLPILLPALPELPSLFAGSKTTPASSP